MEGKRGSECLLKPVSNIDFNPKLVDSIPWQGKEIEEILVLVEEYYNN
ncbi:hypothetical protein [Liquorilactobacillus hordei]|nr:hypothetical protein [Liquorilactobacillus hordei]